MSFIKYIMVFSILTVLFLNPVCTQNISEVLKNSNSKLSSFENISFEVSFLSYAENGLNSRLEMKFEKVDGVIYTAMEDVDSYQLDSTQIIIDHTEKNILLNTGIQTAALHSGISRQLAMLERLEEEAEEITININKGDKTYSLYFLNKQFSQIDIEIDTALGLFQSMRFVPTEPVYNAEETDELPVTSYEILIRDYNTEIKKLSKPYTEFLEFKDGRYILKPTYSTYRYENNYNWK